MVKYLSRKEINKLEKEGYIKYLSLDEKMKINTNCAVIIQHIKNKEKARIAYIDSMSEETAKQHKVWQFKDTVVHV